MQLDSTGEGLLGEARRGHGQRQASVRLCRSRCHPVATRLASDPSPGRRTAALRPMLSDRSPRGPRAGGSPNQRLSITRTAAEVLRRVDILESRMTRWSSRVGPTGPLSRSRSLYRGAASPRRTWSARTPRAGTLTFRPKGSRRIRSTGITRHPTRAAPAMPGPRRRPSGPSRGPTARVALRCALALASGRRSAPPRR